MRDVAGIPLVEDDLPLERTACGARFAVDLPIDDGTVANLNERNRHR
jgi:hypothetical protein